MSELIRELSDFGISPGEFSKMAEEELERRRMGSFLLSNPYAFQRNCLCQPSLVGFLRPFHEEGLVFVNAVTGRKKKLVLWPRGHLKTHLITQGEMVRRAIENPDIRILLNGSTYEIGKSFLTAIRGHLRDERIIRYYGDLLPTSKSGKNYKNNESELTLTTRRNLTLKEPTFTASGLDKTKTSQHYDIIVHDDLVCRENVTTFEAMDQVWKVWQDSMDLLEPGGEMVIIGTRWHPLDLYGRIISDYCDPDCVAAGFIHKPDCKCRFDVSIKEITEDGKYIFDSKFDSKIADELLQIKGRVEFSAQYLNNPTDPGVCWFRHEKLKACETPPSEIAKIRDKLVWYMAIDPAESLESRACFTACAVVGVDHETGDWYVDYAKQAKVDTKGFIDLVWDTRNLYKPHHFGMEFNTRKALAYVLQDRMAALHDYFIIEELKPMLGKTPNAKQERIRRLIPMVEFNRIHINTQCSDLLNQLYTLPNATSWDLADALSYVMDMIPKGLGAEPVTKERMPLKHTQNGAYTYAVRRHGTNTGTAGRFQRLSSGRIAYIPKIA